MFDIPENGKETIISYLKKICEDKRNTESASKIFDNELDKSIKKSKIQNLILTKSLIVKL